MCDDNAYDKSCRNHSGRAATRANCYYVGVCSACRAVSNDAAFR